MKKILIIVIIIVAFLLIGCGVFFGLNEKGNKSDKVVDVDAEIKKNESIHSENVNVYRTIEDAKAYLVGVYETSNVEVTYNDGIKATIKVHDSSGKEISYTYFITSGDLLIDY